MSNFRRALRDALLELEIGDTPSHPILIDDRTGIIKRVSIIRIGPAKGHDIHIDRTTLLQVLNGFPEGGLKAKINHRDTTGVRAICGRWRNPRIEGNALYADCHLLTSHPEFPWIIQMARMQPDDFGVSISCMSQTDTVAGKKVMRITEMKSADFVDDPAANESLFTARDEAEMYFSAKLGAPEIERGAMKLLEISKEQNCTIAEAEKYRRLDVIRRGRCANSTAAERTAAWLEEKRSNDPKVRPKGFQWLAYEKAAGVPFSFSLQDFGLMDAEGLVRRSSIVQRGRAKHASSEEITAMQCELSTRAI